MTPQERLEEEIKELAEEYTDPFKIAFNPEGYRLNQITLTLLRHGFRLAFDPTSYGRLLNVIHLDSGRGFYTISGHELHYTTPSPQSWLEIVQRAYTAATREEEG